MTVPADTPVTMPRALTVATEMLLLLHTPPDGVAVTVAVVPAHVLVAPLIGDIEAVTVTNAVA